MAPSPSEPVAVDDGEPAQDEERGGITARLVPTDDEPALVEALERAPLEPLGYLANASNSTLLCRLGAPEDGLHAVYKPSDGERPLWDFPTGSLCRREVAARVVSEALGWRIVPPTVLRDGPLGEGSAQLFVPHDPREHYFVLVEDEARHEALARIAVLDLVLNNTDRKGSHIIASEADGILRGIDHGVCFHPQPKLRTVVWDLGAYPVALAWSEALDRLAAALASAADPIRTELARLLDPVEVRITAARAARTARMAALPVLAEDRRPYPWPPL